MSNSMIGYRTKKAMKNKKTGSLHKKEVDYTLRSLVFCFFITTEYKLLY